MSPPSDGTDAERLAAELRAQGVDLDSPSGRWLFALLLHGDDGEAVSPEPSAELPADMTQKRRRPSRRRRPGR